MSGSISVRRIRVGDGPHLMRLRLAALLDAPEAFESTYEASSRRPREAWRRRAQLAASGDSETVIVAVDGTNWIAMAGAFSADSGDRVLYGMWVDPDWRRRGVADALVAEVHEWTRAAGAPVLRLWVIENNTAALALYQKHGFLPTGERKQMAGSRKVYEIEMSVRLSGE